MWVLPTTVAPEESSRSTTSAFSVAGWCVSLHLGCPNPVVWLDMSKMSLTQAVRPASEEEDVVEVGLTSTRSTKASQKEEEEVEERVIVVVEGCRWEERRRGDRPLVAMCLRLCGGMAVIGRLGGRRASETFRRADVSILFYPASEGSWEIQPRFRDVRSK